MVVEGNGLIQGIIYNNRNSVIYVCDLCMFCLLSLLECTLPTRLADG